MQRAYHAENPEEPGILAVLAGWIPKFSRVRKRAVPIWEQLSVGGFTIPAISAPFREGFAPRMAGLRIDKIFHFRPGKRTRLLRRKAKRPLARASAR